MSNTKLIHEIDDYISSPVKPSDLEWQAALLEIRGILVKQEKGLNEWAKQIHTVAIAHGWWDKPISFGEIIALCHSELSEALEEYREGKPMVYYPCNAGGFCDKESCGSKIYNPNNPDDCSAQSKKPEGIAVELADCIIRILDYCGAVGINIDAAIRTKHEYNKTRPYRHGKVI